MGADPRRSRFRDSIPTLSRKADHRAQDEHPCQNAGQSDAADRNATMGDEEVDAPAQGHYRREREAEERRRKQESPHPLQHTPRAVAGYAPVDTIDALRYQSRVRFRPSSNVTIGS